MAEKISYPKMIQKKVDGEVATMVVKDAYEHAEMCKKGWSGPPEWGSALPDLEREIAETEKTLAGMKERREYMIQFEAEREKSGVKEEKKKGK